MPDSFMRALNKGIEFRAISVIGLLSPDQPRKSFTDNIQVTDVSYGNGKNVSGGTFFSTPGLVYDNPFPLDGQVELYVTTSPVSWSRILMYGYTVSILDITVILSPKTVPVLTLVRIPIESSAVNTGITFHGIVIDDTIADVNESVPAPLFLLSFIRYWKYLQVVFIDLRTLASENEYHGAFKH